MTLLQFGPHYVPNKARDLSLFAFFNFICSAQLDRCFSSAVFCLVTLSQILATKKQNCFSLSAVGKYLYNDTTYNTFNKLCY